MTKTLSAIRATVRQFLRDEHITDKAFAFANDELDLHIGHCLGEISGVNWYEVRETVVSDGTKEVDISSITDLIGEKIEKAEYPTGSDPPDYRDVSIFGNTLRINIEATPTSGEDVYLYCHKVHQLTESASTLSPDLEKVLVDGVVAMAALAWLNQMRAQIVPASARWYQNWVDRRFAVYQAGLRNITKARVYEFYPRN